MTKSCITCKTLFLRKKSDSYKDFSNKKYCSRKCYGQSMIGSPSRWPTKERISLRKKFLPKICIFCSSKFDRTKNISTKEWSLRKFCSNKCKDSYKKGKPILHLQGITQSKESNSCWKGENAGYRAKHNSITRHFGKPNTCEMCNTSNLSGHDIHWASKDHKYSRNKEDYLRLCASCHSEYDKIHGLRKHI